MNIKTRLLGYMILAFLTSCCLFLAAWLCWPAGQDMGAFLWSGPGLLALGMALTILAAAVVQARLTVPLGNVQAWCGRVTGGDHGARLDGEFIHEMAGLKAGLDAMLAHLAAAMDEAGRQGREAERHAKEAEAALAAAQAKEAEFSGLIDGMRQAAAKAHGVSEKIFSAVRELTSHAERVSEGVTVQRDRMTETATAMEEMNGTVIEVARNAGSAAQSAELSKQNAETGAKGVSQAVESIERVKERVLGLKTTMAELGQQADSIGRIITVITDIADQTNLLALNAAIEAARAGEAGRGFAVVADEVRKLAEKTMSATKEVDEAVQRIQIHARQNVEAVDAAAGNIVESAGMALESGRFMQEIVGIVDNTAVQVASIATASEEQSAASEEINRAVSDVTRVAQETSEAMQESSKALVEVSGLTEDLDSIIQAMASGRIETAASDKLVEWTPALSVGLATIDDQHKVLVNLINELHAAMRRRKSDAIMLDVVNRLKDYTVKHFGNEEELFKRHGYPERGEHEAVHRKFVQKVLEFESGLKGGTAKVTMDIMRFLKDWLVSHIQGTDTKYAPFLKSKGVR